MPQYISLAEMSKREGFGAAAIAEELNKQSAFMGLLPFEVVPGGVKKYGVRAALPNIGFRGVNDTITQSVSVVNPYEESTVIAESNPWIDKAAINGSPAEAMAVEAIAHVEKLRQVWTTSAFYGDKETDPEGMDGLNVRYLYNSGNGQVVSASGTGTDLMSIWVVEFGPNKVQGFISSPDDFLDAQLLPGLHEHPTKGTMGYKAHVWMRAGLAVCDARAAAQIANIETSGSSNILTLPQLHDAVSRVGNPTAIFANRTGILQIQALFDSKVTFGTDEFGRRFMDFGGLPIYREDNLVITEAAKS